jgi:hypothetical protein
MVLRQLDIYMKNESKLFCYWRKERNKDNFPHEREEERPLTELPNFHANHRDLKSMTESISRGFTKQGNPWK